MSYIAEVEKQQDKRRENELKIKARIAAKEAGLRERIMLWRAHRHRAKQYQYFKTLTDQHKMLIERTIEELRFLKGLLE